MRIVNVTAKRGYLATVDRVLAGKPVDRPLRRNEQVMVARHMARQCDDRGRIAAVLGVSKDTVTELLYTRIRLQVPLDAVRCVMCDCANGVLVVGEYVLHRGYRCDLAEYNAPVRLASLPYLRAIRRWAA